jgi:glycine/D-amino acid oxidase-like deaminating enzyme
VDFLIIGNGMFGAAIARYLAPYATVTVTVVGPDARADGSGR